MTWWRIKNRSPAARKEVNENIPQINILNSLQKNSNGITDITSPKFEYKKEVFTEDISHTKINNIPIIPNGITIYTNHINVGHHRKQYSNKLVTQNDISTIEIQKNKAIAKQHNIQFSDSQSSVGISTDSDSSLNNIQKTRHNYKRLPTNLEDIEVHINFNDNKHSDSYISLPKKIETVRKNINHNTYNNNSNSSESDFFLARLNKRRRYCSKKIRSYWK